MLVRLIILTILAYTVLVSYVLVTDNILMLTGLAISIPFSAFIVLTLRMTDKKRTEMVVEQSGGEYRIDSMKRPSEPSPSLKQRILSMGKVDLIFLGFLVLMGTQFQYHIAQMEVAIWDGAVYLENARRWLANEPLLEAYRPQLLSLMIAGIWSVTGENWVIAKYIQAAFTMGAGMVLYLILRKHKSSLFGLGVVVLTLVNTLVFVWSSQIMVEGISLFFLTLSLYFLKSKNSNHWIIAGICMGLTFASRYPIIIPALAIFITEAIVQRNIKNVAKTMVGLVPTIGLLVLVITLKAGTFDTALAKDSELSLLLSPYYAQHAFEIWGFAVVLIPVAFLFRKTISDKFNYAFIAWFAVSFLFWSANVSNHQVRFMIQIMPAAYFLAMLAVENIWKIEKISLPTIFKKKKLTPEPHPQELDNKIEA